MKKYLLSLLLMFAVFAFAQAAGDAGANTTAGVGATTTTTTGTTGGTPGGQTIETTAATLKELEDLRKAVADQKKELDDQKTAAELAKLSEVDRAKALLDNERKALDSDRQKLTLDKNNVFAKSVLLSENINIGGEFLPYLNITAADKEPDITTRATNLKSALDAYVKKFIDDKTGNFDPAKKGGSTNDTVAAYAAKLVGKGEVKDNPYFKL